jgi:DNA-3-methyladenine glycosylase II
LSVEFRVQLQEHVDVSGSLELFRRSGDDQIDRWDGQRLVRAVPTTEHRWIPFVARATRAPEGPAFSVAVDNATHVEPVGRAVIGTFTRASNDFDRLVQEDPVVARLDARFPGIRQIRQLDLFTALIRCISAQQVNLRWAVTTRRRLAQTFGHRHVIDGEVVYALDPERIARVDPAQIRALQFTTSKSLSIVATAQALTATTDLELDRLSVLEDDEIIQRLIEIRGIGRWSADWVLARTLGRPRVVAGDLGVRKAVGLAYLSTPLPSESEVRAATAHWGDSASTAQALLLHALAEGALTSGATPGRTGWRAESLL